MYGFHKSAFFFSLWNRHPLAFPWQQHPETSQPSQASGDGFVKTISGGIWHPMLSEKFVAIFFCKMSLSQLLSGFVRPTHLFHGVRSVVLLKETSWAGTKVLYVTLSEANISKFRPVPPPKKKGVGSCLPNQMDGSFRQQSREDTHVCHHGWSPLSTPPPQE